MKCFLILVILSLFCVKCKDNTPVYPSVPEYFSLDYGVNDYLPLAVGNMWFYNYDVEKGTLQIGQSWQESVQTLETRRNLVQSVRKIDDSTELFTVQVVKKFGKDSSVYYEEFRRTKERIFVSRSFSLPRSVTTESIPRTGTADTYGGYKKGVGLVESTWGIGYTTRTYYERYIMKLQAYNIKK